jgi:hypothetical protein
VLQVLAVRAAKCTCSRCWGTCCSCCWCDFIALAVSCWALSLPVAVLETSVRDCRHAGLDVLRGRVVSKTLAAGGGLGGAGSLGRCRSLGRITRPVWRRRGMAPAGHGAVRCGVGQSAVGSAFGRLPVMCSLLWQPVVLGRGRKRHWRRRRQELVECSRFYHRRRRMACRRRWQETEARVDEENSGAPLVENGRARQTTGSCGSGRPRGALCLEQWMYVVASRSI